MNKTNSIFNEILETAIEAVGGAIIVDGATLLLTESVAFPPLAVTIPVAAAALPQAYANLEAVAEFAGDQDKETCHRLFQGNKD